MRHKLTVGHKNEVFIKQKKLKYYILKLNNINTTHIHRGKFHRNKLCNNHSSMCHMITEIPLLQFYKKSKAFLRCL